MTLLLCAGGGGVTWYAALHVGRYCAQGESSAARAALTVPLFAILGCLIPLGWLLTRHGGRLEQSETAPAPRQDDSPPAPAAVSEPAAAQHRQGGEEPRPAGAGPGVPARSDFLAHMSHEIRTPLNASLGMLYLLQQTPLDDRQRYLTEKAQDAGNLLLRIVDHILDYSRMEAGKMELEQTPFSLRGVLRDLRDIAAAAREKPIHLVLEVAAELPDALVGDAFRLGQVLLDLTDNALKFTDRGTVTVRVEPAPAAASELALRFSVRDTGKGMAPEQQGEILRPFTQEDNSTTRRFGGTGLGLAISRKLVELMGGEISVASEPGAGSTFSFTARFALPRDAEVAPLRDPGARAGAAPGEEVRLDGVRVLLVEDVCVNQEVAREILQGRGVTVDVAENGAEAVRLVTSSPARYHAVLMDVQMPVMDGLEATRRIRSNAAFAALPIIAMTASVPGGDRLLCLKAGMNDQVKKPIDVPGLFATLARWVTPLPGAAAPAGTRPEEPFPRSLPGIDLEQALRRVGSRQLFLRLLRTFAREHAESVRRLRQALERGESAEARRIVHTLKGVAGTLAADAVSAVASRTEEAMKVGAPLGALLDELERELSRVVQGVEELVAREEVAHEGGGCAPPAETINAVALAGELAQLLESANPDALKVWERLKPFLREGDVRTLEGLLNALDFADAALLLRGIAVECGWRLQGEKP